MDKTEDLSLRDSLSDSSEMFSILPWSGEMELLH